MYEKDKKHLRRRIGRLIRSGRLTKGKQIYVFGINDRTREAMSLLKENGIPVAGIIENDAKKKDLYYGGVKTVQLAEIDRVAADDHIYLLYSGFWREMKQQLLVAGVREWNIIRLFRSSRLNETVCGRTYAILAGRRVYRQLRRKYGEHARLLLCPYTGTGDIYLIGTLLGQYLVQYSIDDYVLIVVNTPCRKVAELFGLTRVEQLKNVGRCSYLVEYYLCCPEECRIEVLNDSWGQLYTNPTEWMRGLHGLNFTEMFRRFVFRLPDTAKPVAPHLRDQTDAVRALFETHGLIQGKTVILSPYATTLADLRDVFWVELAEHLKERGYHVCTNADGKKEPAVKGTPAVFCPLNIAPQFVSAAGYFIGVRSGFCDVISAAKAKKIILYDKNNFFFNSTAYEYFSLNEMGLCDDAIEIEYESGRTDFLMDEIKVLFA